MYDLQRRRDCLFILISGLQPIQKLNTTFQEPTIVSRITDFSRISYVKSLYALYRSSNSRQTVSRLPAKCIGPLQLLPLYRLHTNHSNQHCCSRHIKLPFLLQKAVKGFSCMTLLKTVSRLKVYSAPHLYYSGGHSLIVRRRLLTL